ncbi:MAG TPA: hypothetical protein VMU84_08230, partial [Thermoanaerobaculia bacterium]|nr:hypothetical protein [Thermoanaerobaculia bacterium]
PYEWLDDSEQLEPGTSSFLRQLEISVERLRNYDRGACVIAERSPIDFVAYLLALDEEPPIELAARGMAHVDLLVVLPLNDRDGIVAPESEDLELRDAMNERLLEILATDLLGDLRVIELQGSRQRRLAMLERLLL